MFTKFFKPLAAALIGLLPCASLAAIEVLPAPKSIEVKSGVLPLPSQIQTDKAFLSHAKSLSKALNAITGKNYSVTVGKPVKTAINFMSNKEAAPEEYSLNTSNGIMLRASTTAGIARATSTLIQLANKNAQGTWELPKVIIKDQPDFEFRSFLVDMGRNPHSPETIRRVVDMMWLGKINYLHLHLTDDQLFSWPSTAYPKLLSKRAGWKLEDWKELEAYSQARGVTIIPELEMPGHSEIFRKVHPEIFGKTKTDLATLDSAYKGLTTVLREIMDVFQASPYIHIGADEAFGVDEDIQRKFINRMNKYVRSQGRTTIVWEGPRPGNKKKGEAVVDTSVIQMNWRSHEYTPADMIRDGYKIINATWDPLYIVDHYPRTMFTAVETKAFYDFNIQRFKHVNPDFPTYKNPSYIKTSKGIIGFCLPWWEGRENNIFPICRQRLNAANARVWNSKGEQSFESFMKRDAKLAAMLETIRPYSGKPPTGGWSDRQEKPTPGNLAHAKPVHVSAGKYQPLFGPQRLTNGATDTFDHFLGYPTVPKPLEITIDLGEAQSIGRVEIYEAARGKSWEKYVVSSSMDNKKFSTIGKTTKDSRAGTNKVSFTFDPLKARYIRISTDGCKDYTFPSFSRLCEVMVFEK